MNGFLDTDGRLYECEPWGHLDEAYDIVENMGVPVANRLKAEEYLQKLGWIVVRTHDVYSLIGFFKDDSSGIRYHLTDAQKDWFNKAYEDMTSKCRESIDEMFERDK